MKEKLLWSIIVLLGVALVLAHAQTSLRTEPSPVGRYQIVAAPNDPTFGVQIIRIDTTTGKAWIEAMLPGSGGVGHSPRWVEIPEGKTPK